MIAAVVLVMLLIALLQAPSLVNRKKWPELAGFSAVWFTAAIFALLVTAAVPLPNPIELLGSFYGWLFPLIGVHFNLFP